MNVLQLVFLIGKGHVKSAGKAVAEIVRCTRLKRLAVMHKSFDGIGSLRTRELVALGFSALNNGHIENVTAKIGIDIEHALRLLNCLLCGCVYGVPLLPEKFSRTQERSCCFLPSYDVAPLIIEFGKISV